MKKKFRIGITGTTGFVGRSLAHSALTQGWEVHAFSRTETGITGVIEHFWDSSQVMTEEQQNSFASLNLDAIIHSAAKTNDWGTYEEFNLINVQGTQQALLIAPQARFIYLSTASVYLTEDNKIGLQPQAIEPTSHLRAHSMYAYTKLLGEHITLADNRQKGVMVVRPHIIYGPGDTTLLPRVLAQTKIRKNKAILRIPGAGKGFHSVTSITTLTDFLLFSVVASVESITAHGRIFNIADSVPVILSQKIKEVVKDETQVEEVIIKNIPVSLSLVVAYTCELFHKTIRKKSRPPLTRYMVKELTEDTVLNLEQTQKFLYS